jgi:signal recognition particle receptor subunit beta
VAILDVARKTITLKIVYYGCALGGKTTNLVTLHRLTDPEGRHGLVSIATNDDRTLFFDLLPFDLGQVGGLQVRAKVYTVPGQVHYELTRRQVLAGADGIVLVVDSSPEAADANRWALENLRFNLKANGLDPERLPTVLQWNKRDLPEARPVRDLEADLNPKKLPAFEAVATTGAGVLETFSSILTASILNAYGRAGRPVAPAAEIAQIVERALEQARSRVPKVEPAAEPPAVTYDHRMDVTAYRERWAERGRDRRIVDQEALLAEAVQTNMELAERLDEVRETRRGLDRRGAMLEAIGRLAVQLPDPGASPIPRGTMAGLLEAAGRSRGSILLFRPPEQEMEEREVVPGGRDPLNSATAASLGSAAFRLAQGAELRVVESLDEEVFFGQPPPHAAGLVSALIAPLRCDGVAFGALVVYSHVEEEPFEAAEKEYWRTAASFLSLSLHWRALRRKLVRFEPAGAGEKALREG